MKHQDLPALRELMSCTITECSLKELNARYYVGRIESTFVCNNAPGFIVNFNGNLGFSDFKKVKEFLKTHPGHTWARVNQIDESYFRYKMTFKPVIHDWTPEQICMYERVFEPEDFEF